MTPFFDVDPKRPLVSVVLCSRGRPELMKKSLDSLLSTARFPGAIQFLIKVDDDDPETIKVAEHFQKTRGAILGVGPRGHGYAEIAGWTSQLTKMAASQWTIWWNDDAEMLTNAWDERLVSSASPGCWHPCPSSIFAIRARVNNRSSNEFIFWRTRMFEILGGVGASPYADTWNFRLLTALDSIVDSPTDDQSIHVSHHPAGLTPIHDETRHWQQLLHESLNSLAAIRCQQGAVSHLLSFIELHFQEHPPLDAPAHPGWWYWREAPGLKPAHLFWDGTSVINVVAARPEHLARPLSAYPGEWIERG